MIIGIDVGGTKTQVLVEDGETRLLDLSVPTLGWRYGDLLDDQDNAARLLATFEHIEGASSAPLVIGAHGLDSPWQIAEFQGWMRERHGGPVRTVNDVELLGPAAGFADATAVIAGTGSRIVAHTVTGEIISAGGYGFILSDPGSAPALAREAVRTVLDALDEGRAPDALGSALMAHYGVDDEVALALRFTIGVGIGEWAELGPLVFAAADAGSELAISVIDEAARQLAVSVAQVHRRGAVGRDVICAGGVISNQPRLYRALTRHIDELGLGLTVHLLQVAPVLGAVALARKLSSSATVTPSRRNA